MSTAGPFAPVDDGLPLAPAGPIEDGVERRFSDQELVIIRERGYRHEQHAADVSAWVSKEERDYWGEDAKLLSLLAGSRMRDHELLRRLEWPALRLLDRMVTELGFHPDRAPNGNPAFGVGLPFSELQEALRCDEVALRVLVDDLSAWQLSTCHDQAGALWLVVANTHFLPIPSQCWLEVILRECRATQAARKAPRSRLSPLAA